MMDDSTSCEDLSVKLFCKDNNRDVKIYTFSEIKQNFPVSSD